jgi:hypothetical protein
VGSAIVHKDTGWLAHIIVHPAHRNNGVGRLITETLLNNLHKRNCTTINLIATELGAPVYAKLGFETETEYLFFKDLAPDATWGMTESVVPYTSDFKQQIVAMDFRVSGEDRMFHLEQYLPGAYVYLEDGLMKGYYLPSFGEGMVVADNSNAGLGLMKFRLSVKENAAFPKDNLAASVFFHDRGYKEFKTAKRMRLGIKREWQPGHFYNRVGGNLG